MIKLVWSTRFVKAVKKAIKKNPELLAEIESTLYLLESNPYNPSLKTHKLKGKFQGCWSCSIEYNYRIIFEIYEFDNNLEILLLSIGTHDEVY